MSSTASSDSGTSTVPPSITRSAVSGRSSARAFKAPWAPAMERISIQWPSSMMTMSVESSHQISISKRPAWPIQLTTKATTMAIAMSVIMPGWRSASSPRAPRRNTPPP